MEVFNHARFWVHDKAHWDIVARDSKMQDKRTQLAMEKQAMGQSI